MIDKGLQQDESKRDLSFPENFSINRMCEVAVRVENKFGKISIYSREKHSQISNKGLS